MQANALTMRHTAVTDQMGTGVLSTRTICVTIGAKGIPPSLAKPKSCLLDAVTWFAVAVTDVIKKSVTSSVVSDRAPEPWR